MYVLRRIIVAAVQKQVLSKVADASQAKHSAGCAGGCATGENGEMMIRGGVLLLGAKLVPEEGSMNADN